MHDCGVGYSKNKNNSWIHELYYKLVCDGSLKWERSKEKLRHLKSPHAACDMDWMAGNHRYKIHATIRFCLFACLDCDWHNTTHHARTQTDSNGISQLKFFFVLVVFRRPLSYALLLLLYDLDACEKCSLLEHDQIDWLSCRRPIVHHVPLFVWPFCRSNYLFIRVPLDSIRFDSVGALHWTCDEKIVVRQPTANQWHAVIN